MAALKSTITPNTYLRVNRSNGAIMPYDSYKIQNGNDEQGNPIPDTVVSAGMKLIIGFSIYKSEAQRWESETDTWIKSEQGSETYDYVPDLPTGWQPKNPANRQLEEYLAKCYLALLADPKYSEWVSDEV